MLAWARLCVLAGSPGDSATQYGGISGYRCIGVHSDLLASKQTVMPWTCDRIQAESARHGAVDNRIQIASLG
jgi:hypothetical protein